MKLDSSKAFGGGVHKFGAAIALVRQNISVSVPHSWEMSNSVTKRVHSIATIALKRLYRKSPWPRLINTHKLVCRRFALQGACILPYESRE